MNAPFPRRVLRSYQEKATTYLLIAYEFIEVPALGGPRGVECGEVARVPSRIGRPWPQSPARRVADGVAVAELVGRADGTVYRPGQTRHVTVHVCVVAETVDEMKRDRLIGKISAQEAFRQHLEQV